MTDPATSTTLRPLEPRPVGYGGGSVPLDLARWLRVTPVTSVGFGEKEGTIVLQAADSHAVTPFGDRLSLGPSTTIDGKKTLVALSDWLIDQIDPIIAWERRNPEERPFGAETIGIDLLKIQAAHLLGTPAGGERVRVLDRLLSLRPEEWRITRLRERLRADPDDLAGTCVAVVAEITDM